MWQFRFAKEFCNVARPAGSPRNQLPDLLRGWFGPRAGQPGTAFQIRFHAGPDGLWVEPVQTAVTDITSRNRIVAYPDLRAAAGHIAENSDASPGEAVWLPIDEASPELFAVRVSGSSMDGGEQPLRDGDWAVMRVSRGEPASAFENRVVLVEVHTGTLASYQIKRLQRQGTQWLLTSDNPSGPTIEAGDAMVPIARLERVVSPSDLAPANGTLINESELPSRFGLEELEPQSARHQGHLFIFVTEKGQLPEPDRVNYEAVTPRPSETAFVLARRAADPTYRYLGIARQTEDHGVWSVPDVDHATWRDYGSGRDVSRRLPEGATARAQLVVDALLARPEPDRWLQRAEGNRGRVVGAAARGGIRVDGGPGGFVERTVSLVDLAWVVVAADDVAANGGVLDESRVNRLRYLEGVPKGSTRWIDTGWAIAGWQATKGDIRNPTAGFSDLHQLRRDNGAVIDASFRVERVGDVTTLIFESRGGTRGSANERNADYAEGLELILARLKTKSVPITDVLVESRDTESISLVDRRLPLVYPLTIADAREVRRQISAMQARIGRTPGARGGGNQTRRLRLFLGDCDLGPRELAAYLATAQ